MSRPLRVLFVCLSPGWGGMEMYLHRTGVPLRERGHEVVIAAPPGSPTARAAQEAGLTLAEVPYGPSQAFAIPRLAGVIRDHRIDLVHAHRSKDLGRLVMAMKLVGRRPLVFTEWMGVRRSKRDPYHTWVYARVDRVLSISEECQRANLEALPITREQSRLLYGGVELGGFDPAEHPDQAALRRSFGLPESGVLVGLIGRISRMKGHEVLAAAAAELAPRIPDVHFVMVGDGGSGHGGEADVMAELQVLAERPPLAGRLHFTGYTPRIAEANRALDVATCCSEREAFGYTVIESMAMGLPVVASDTGAMPELIRDGESGALFRQGDGADLAAKLEPIVTDRARREAMGRAARARAVERFSMRRHLDDLEAIYRELL